MPKFSIIVGAYNQLETLKKTIESLQAQTFKNFEVEICDDGSSDGTEEFMRKAEKIYHPGFAWRYHRQKHTGILSKNLNQGIKVAKGEYCVFLMADSFLETNYLEVLSGWVQPNRLICGIRVQVDEGQGVDIDYRLKKELVPNFNSIILGQPWICLTGNGLTVPTEAFRRHGGWCEKMKGYGGDDTELVGRLFFKGYIPYSVVDLRLYHHWHKGTLSVNSKIAKKLITKYAS